MDPFTDKVSTMSEAARGWLSHGQRGKVLAVVTHATYLLTEEGELVWLATKESPMHRRCMQLSSRLPHLTIDSTFTIRGKSIDFEPGGSLNFHDSHVWEAPALPVGDVIEIGRLPDKLFAVCELFLARETLNGYGTFIQHILEITKKQEASTGIELENILTMTAWPIVERIARACLSHDLPGVFRQAEALIGLGEGLTPSGDDFLGGLFFARHLLSCSYPNLFYLEFSNIPEWIDAYQPHTNLISFFLLKDNAVGHALEPINRFGIALLTNQTVASAISAASDLIKVGHSTGWDLLTGFLVGMLLVFPN